MRDRLAVAAAVAVFAIAVVVFAAQHWDSVYDDTLIYLRYVKNLRHGCGLRFNCDGPPVEGFTGPLYLAVLYAGSFVTDQLIDLCQVVGTLSLIGAGALAIVLGKRFGLWVAVATALVLALDPYVHLNANIGMETALAALLVTLVAFAAITERAWLLTAAACGTVLVRPEGMLFVVALPLLVKPRQLIAAGAFVVTLVAARYAVFGELVPNTYLAKSGGTWTHAHLGLAYLRDALLDFPLAFAAPLILLRDRSRPVSYLLGVSGAWLLFFLRTGGDLFEYSRLVLPLVPMLSVLALAGIARRRWLPVLLAAAVGLRAAIVHHIPPQHANPRVVEWAALGTYLRTRYPHELIAVVPIGAIGYYSGLPIIDLVGLTEPEIAHAGRSVPPGALTKLWIGHERHDTEYVLRRAPRVIVTTMHRAEPWRTLEEAKTGFYADWLILQEIKAGRAPYHVADAELAGGNHYLTFERDAGR